MDAEEVLNLLDACWFELEIFKTFKVHENVEKTKSSMPTIRYDSSFKIREEIIENPMKKKKSITKRNKSRNSKSLSELEFEELKGFTDLGFIFSEEDKNSELVSVVPGLNRLGIKGVGEIKNEDLVSRPYLSEAWGDIDRKLVSRNLINWKIQALNDRTNLKDHLKVWAQTVALAVRL